MARWLREHLGFRSAKPAPPKPDYRPDILAAYRLQRERDFEDPYSGAGPGPPAPDARYGSPKHRLIKVDAAEKVGSPGEQVGQMKCECLGLMAPWSCTVVSPRLVPLFIPTIFLVIPSHALSLPECLFTPSSGLSTLVIPVSDRCAASQVACHASVSL
uniref:Uncharacterized protein n=1 Tax=Pelusios castaneus TaxID=367368 RepID=A0A8C8SPT6_9SAUR